MRHLLGREIVGAAQNPLFLLGARWVKAPLAESEVGESGLAPQREQDVRGLEIAVNQALGVYGREPPSDRGRELESFFTLHGPGAAQPCFQRLAVHPLHHVVGPGLAANGRHSGV